MKVLALQALPGRPPRHRGRRTDSRGGGDILVGGPPEVSVLLAEGGFKVRRVALPAGAVIPPCRMEHDVVFVVLAGRVLFTVGEEPNGGAAAESAAAADVETAEVAAPGAVFVPGGATSRSMRALTQSLVLAVLCRGAETSTSSAAEDAS